MSILNSSNEKKSVSDFDRARNGLVNDVNKKANKSHESVLSNVAVSMTRELHSKHWEYFFNIKVLRLSSNEAGWRVPNLRLILVNHEYF